MRNLWYRFNNTQQNQILILVSALMLGAYALWFSGLYKDNTKLEQMINRRLDRIETRAAPIAEPTNSAATEKQIQQLQKNLTDNNRNLQRLLQRFAPLDNPVQQQLLRRELSELASGLGMRVIKLEGALKRNKDLQIAPDFDAKSEIDRRFGRPLLIFEAWGSYFALQTLLDDLDSLSYTIAPVNIRITADEPTMSARQALEHQQVLRIELVLAI
jgi:hypothetical protein